MKNSFEVAEDDGQLTISSQVFKAEAKGMGAGHWEVSQIDNRRFMLELASEPPQPREGFAKCSVDLFKDFLLGLHRRRWSGVVTVDQANGLRRIFYTNGEITFASSTIMDDRLGEVIYRSGRISLDQMADSATQVTKELKFGQVLLRSGALTNIALWEALKDQVREIVRSIFTAEGLYFEMRSGKGLAFTEVVFERGTEELIDASYAHGCMFRDFVTRIEDDAKVSVSNPQAALAKHRPGTFIGDLLQLIGETPRVGDLVAASKLSRENTYASLMQIINKGICDVVMKDESDARGTREVSSAIKSLLDTYELVLTHTQTAFEEEGVEFPGTELRSFAYGLNPEGFTTLFLDAKCRIGRICLLSIASQCRINPDRERYFEVRIDSLIQFVLQVAMDLLSKERSHQIRATYREMTL